MRTAPARPGIWGSLEREIEVRPGPGADGKLWDTLSDRVDITQLRPKLADDIEVKEFRLKWGNDYVIVGNPRDLIHYRFDLEDAPLLKLMDGTRTVKEIVLERFRESGDLELAGVADMVRQLYEGNFLEQRYLDVDAAVNHAVDPVPVRRQKAREFAKTLTIEWMGADRVVTWLYRHGLKYLFNKAVTVLAILFSIAGLVAFFAIAGDNRFDLAGNSLAIGFLVLLGLDYFMVFVHELGHALVLTHYGRQIKSAGFQIYFGSPAFFVESSDSLLMERNQQIMQSAYGPFAQFVIGAVASIIPWAFPGWVLSPTLYKFAVLNYLVLFMNLVPMLELDGYYILADAIQVPDLRERSLSFIRSEF